MICGICNKIVNGPEDSIILYRGFDRMTNPNSNGDKKYSNYRYYHTPCFESVAGKYYIPRESI